MKYLVILEMMTKMLLKLINEIASNVHQIMYPYKEKLISNKFKYIKIFPIIIEGLDCVGKNTLSTTLYNKLKDMGRNVVLLSFPDYESDSGKEIKNILHMEGKRNGILEQKLQILMIKNRMDALEELKNKIDKPENKDKIYYIIFDRFFLSNFAYAAEPANSDELLELVNESPLYKLVEFESDMFFEYFDNDNKGISIILSYNENDPDKKYDENISKIIENGKKIHKEFLDKKLDKDSNETIEKQLIVSSIYDIDGLDKKFHKVSHFLRYRPNQSMTSYMEDNIIPEILELI